MATVAGGAGREVGLVAGHVEVAHFVVDGKADQVRIVEHAFAVVPRGSRRPCILACATRFGQTAYAPQDCNHHVNGYANSCNPSKESGNKCDAAKNSVAMTRKAMDAGM
jgi:hypothetical protein